MIFKDKILGVRIKLKSSKCIGSNCYFPRSCKESFIPLRGGGDEPWTCLGYDKCNGKPNLDTNDKLEDYPGKKKKLS